MSLLPRKREIISFLPMCDLYTEYKDHERLTVFANKGLDCATCNRVGSFLIVSKETHKYEQSRQRGSVGNVHIDVYTDDFILMTVDHIVPRSVARELGWTREQIEALDNKQPMCDTCNSKKSNKLNEPAYQVREPRTIEGAIGLLVPNIHRMLGDAV